MDIRHFDCSVHALFSLFETILRMLHFFGLIKNSNISSLLETFLPFIFKRIFVNSPVTLKCGQEFVLMMFHLYTFINKYYTKNIRV